MATITTALLAGLLQARSRHHIVSVLATGPMFPLAHRWLQRFAYQTRLGPDVLGIPALVALAVALVAISWQSAEGALTDPVASLRDE